MAMVIQCDACKSLTRHADALRVTVCRTEDVYRARPTQELDVCPRCYRRLMHTFNLDKDVKDNAD